MIKFYRTYLLLKDIILYTDTRVSVVVCSISYIYWGCTFLLPQDVINRPYYSGLSLISSNELLWGFMFLALGLLKIYNLLSINFSQSDTLIKAYVYLVKVLSCLLSLYVFFTSGLNGSLPPVAGDTLAVCLLAWWDFLRFDETSYRKMYLNLLLKKDN